MKKANILLIGIVNMLTACNSNEEGELRRYMQEVKSRPPKTIEFIPEFVPPLKFAYPEDEKRRSPFKPLEAAQKVNALAPDINRPKQSLEAFPLDSLKFVGILKENSTIWGLISQPGGLITRVSSGDYMGKHYGQIIRITDDSIQIEETVQVGGTWEKKPITLKLGTQ